MNTRPLEQPRQVAYATRRRAELARWLELFELLQAVRPRSNEERLAQYQAVELLRQSRIQDNESCNGR